MRFFGIDATIGVSCSQGENRCLKKTLATVALICLILLYTIGTVGQPAFVLSPGTEVAASPSVSPSPEESAAPPSTEEPEVSASPEPSFTLPAWPVVASEALDAVFEEYSGFYGSVLIEKDGQVLLHKGYGVSDADSGTLNTPATKFLIGSVTKQFTAMAIMQLYERELLDINDKLSDYIPDFPRGRHRARRPAPPDLRHHRLHERFPNHRRRDAVR